jgi:hypothetical protein
MMVVLGTFIPFSPLAEELGWRGYALPRLEKAFPPLLSSMILGIIWAAWHVPMFWFSPIGLPSRNLGAIGMWAANLMGFSVLLSYAARRTSFGVPIAILLHAKAQACANALGCGTTAQCVAPEQYVGSSNLSGRTRFLLLLRPHSLSDTWLQSCGLIA